MEEMINNIDIVCSTDRIYAPYCGIMLYSLLSNNRDNNKTIVVHILSDGIDDLLKEKLLLTCKDFDAKCIFYDVKVEKLNLVKFRSKNPLSKAAYFRILLGSTLPSTVKKILYLDCDIIVDSNIYDLFSIDLSNYALAAVRDGDEVPVNDEHRAQLNFTDNTPYFNSGVILINLDFWRANEVEPALISFSTLDRFVYFHDQDALNYIFKDKWFELSPVWNKYNVRLLKNEMFHNEDDYKSYLYKPKIIHYASRYFKPWFRIFGLNEKKKFDYYRSKSRFFDIKDKKTSNLLFIYRTLLIINYKNFLFKAPRFIAFIGNLPFDFINFIKGKK